MAFEGYLAQSDGWHSIADGEVIPYGTPPPPGEQFPGDPGDGNYYVAWANGPGSGGAGDLSAGNSWSQNKISVYHDYSTTTNQRVSPSQLDGALNNGCIASQSFKLGAYSKAQILAGNADADITTSAAACIAREPDPIWLCFHHEPGGDYTTDAARTEYREAYRYIVQRMRNEGVTNVAWMPIQEAPYDYRPSGYSPGGGRGVDFRKFHPDWNGGTTNTRADFYDDLMMDIQGLDIYNPLVGGTSFQDYDAIWNSVIAEWDNTNFPIDEYGGIVIMEMGWSDVIDPDPDWLAYSEVVKARQVTHNIKCFTWWNNNNDSPKRYDFNVASDANGDKLAGWHNICDDAVVWVAP